MVAPFRLCQLCVWGFPFLHTLSSSSTSTCCYISAIPGVVYFFKKHFTTNWIHHLFYIIYADYLEFLFYDVPVEIACPFFFAFVYFSISYRFVRVFLIFLDKDPSASYVLQIFFYSVAWIYFSMATLGYLDFNFYVDHTHLFLWFWVLVQKFKVIHVAILFSRSFHI